MPPTVHLPFLIVHGAVVWKVLLYALVCASYLPFARRLSTLSRHLVVVVVATTFWTVILHAVGKDSLGKMSKGDVESGSEITSTSIAAAMPGTRADALDRIEDWHWRARGAKEVAYAYALSSVTGTCPASMFEDAQRYEEALFYFKRCGKREDVARILFYTGRYEEAAVWAGSDMTDDMAVTSGAWTVLAARLDDRAARRLSAHSATNARCLAALFRAWDGKANAFAVLPDDVKTDVACSVYRVLALPLSDQTAAFHQLPDEVQTADRWIDLCKLFGRCEERFYGDTDLAVWSGGSERVWNDVARSDSQNLHLARSVTARYRGDFATARDELAKAPVTNDFDMRHESMQIDGAQGLGYSGEKYAVEEWDFIAVDAKACKEQLVVSVDAARAGDGRPLAKLLEECNPIWSQFNVPFLMQLLPTVKEGRDALAEGLRYFRGYPYDAGRIPIATHAIYRDLAHLIGDTDEEQRWQGVVDREAAMLADWHKSMALMLLW